MTEAERQALLDRMTVAEQASMLAGRDFWTTVPVARLGIPSIKVSDGPNGARGGAFIGGVTAAAYPVGIALAATWNIDLVRELSGDLAREARSKGAHVLLAPTVNIHRSTLNGRNFECYSEDPFLTTELAVAYIEGLQAQGVGAAVKHFVGNESEYQRTTISSDIDERTLREIYLPPFEGAVKRAKVWALMSSYNRLNGIHVSDSAAMLSGILRREWGFDGVVMSDWGGTYSTVAAIEAGLDLEMPGPGTFRGNKLIEAYEDGRVSAAAIHAAAARILRLIDRVGAFADRQIADERADNRGETRALIRRAGAEASVLLKNAGALPLTPGAIAKLAVIGPNAKTARAMGGGSAQLNPHYLVSPYEALREALPEAEIVYELGADNRRLAATMKAEIIAEFFDGPSFAGPARRRIETAEAIFLFTGSEGPGVAITDFSARLLARQVAEVDGEHQFSLISTGPSRLYVDGELVVDNWDFSFGEEFFATASDEVSGFRRLEAGRAYEITVEWRAPEHRDALTLTALRVGLSPLVGSQAIEHAVEIAAAADVALVFVGLNGEWDAEGRDRPHLTLPGAQDELVRRVAAANPKTIVVLQSGCPVLAPWLGDVAALVQAWYPGQDAGHAIADVLLGAAEPGGRLPQTFPHRLEDDPTRINYPGEAGHVRYGEGVYVGYRYAEKVKIAPLFPFGFGLSYTRFSAGPLRLDKTRIAPGETINATLEVTNVGDRAGTTVVQLYVRDELASVSRPEKELKGFAKILLRPGETRTVTLALDMRALAYFDVMSRRWTAEAGAFRALVGFSSAEIVGSAAFSLTGIWRE